VVLEEDLAEAVLEMKDLKVAKEVKEDQVSNLIKLFTFVILSASTKLECFTLSRLSGLF